MNNGKFFAGLALGALVGSALSCFAHSNRGRKLRRDVYDAIQDLQEDAKDLAHHAKHKAEEVSSEVAGKVGEKVEFLFESFTFQYFGIGILQFFHTAVKDFGNIRPSKFAIITFFVYMISFHCRSIF